jgi:flagellar motor switch protein FliM
MRSVVDRTLRELEYAYETLVRVEAEIVQQEFNPQFAQIAAPSDMAMVVSFDTRIGEKHGSATICVPFSTMQPVLESLASQSLFQDHRGQDPVIWQQQLERAIERVSIQTCVRFDDVGLSSSEIVGLQVGDIVPLDHPHRTTRDDQRRRRDLQQGRHRPAGSGSPAWWSTARGQDR